MHYTDVLIGATINTLRMELGIKILVISQPTLSRIEAGTSALKLRDLFLLCECFDITPQQFFNRMDKITPKTKISL